MINGVAHKVQIGERVAKVMVVDKDPLVRRGLSSLFQNSTSVSVSGEATSVSGALEVLATDGPSVILITVNFLREAGIGFINQLRQASAIVRPIVTGSQITKKTLLSAVEAGAFAFISSETSLEDFEYVIHEAISSQRPVLPEIASELLFHALSRSEHRQAGHELTRREREVLDLIAQGMSNKEIAATLFVSVGTVKAHVSNLLRKLGAADRTQAVLKAIKEGLVETIDGY